MSRNARLAIAGAVGALIAIAIAKAFNVEGSLMRDLAFAVFVGAFVFVVDRLLLRSERDRS
jgi:uncharacterized membrane protein YeaQ/YmgE (transglycosylase-associated protein family)